MPNDEVAPSTNGWKKKIIKIWVNRVLGDC